MPEASTAPETAEFRFAPAIAGRLVGALLVLVAVLLALVTVVVAVAALPLVILVVFAAVGLVAALVAGHWLTRRVAVVRLGPDGYRVRLVRGAGVRAAPWSEVQEVATAAPGGLPVVRLRLVGGDCTTIPVTLLAADREEFVRVLRDHLRHGQGLRPLS